MTKNTKREKKTKQISFTDCDGRMESQQNEEINVHRKLIRGRQPGAEEFSEPIAINYHAR